MVYRGKISKACLQCRRRKLRCDLQRDACGQCIRASLTCTGYRDPNQLRVRDESRAIQAKFIHRSTLVLPQSLSMTIDERARCAFFHHYVSGFARSYDVLGLLYRGRSSFDAHLAVSLDAVSLAFFCRFYSGQKLSLVRERYLRALSLLNQALGCSDLAKKDSTLLAALLLDLFEKLTNNRPESSESWMGHVRGALALIYMRESTQFLDYAGLRMAVRLSTNLLISCLTANSPVPPALLKLRADIEPFLGKADPKWRISSLVAKYANLQAAVQRRQLSDTETIARARDLDWQFYHFSRNMPSTWMYRRNDINESQDMVFEHYFDIYPDHFVTQTWNVLRAMRILLHSMIRGCSNVAAEGGSATDSENGHSQDWNLSVQTIDDMAKEICAAVPQFIQSDNCSLSQEYSQPHKLKCYTLLFPLYVAGLHARFATKIRPWIIKQLKYMYNKIGIQGAGMVAASLESGDGTNPWLIYVRLGSYALAA